MICFDIETMPQPGVASRIDDPPAPANYKDPAKIAEFVKDAKAKLVTEAALSPFYGQVLAIGCWQDISPKPRLFHGYDEPRLLAEFWDFYRQTREAGHALSWCGFNTHGFDWPMLIKRSFINHIKPPALIDQRGYLVNWLIDLRLLWNCGDRQAKGTLGEVAEALGVGKKSGNGAEFAKLYAENTGAALLYLENDLSLTRGIASVLL